MDDDIHLGRAARPAALGDVGGDDDGDDGSDGGTADPSLRCDREKADESGSPAWRIYALAAGYLAVWSLFSGVATAVQRLLAAALVLTPMMEAASARVSAGILAIAGLYQLTPWKNACLRSCRSPLGFMVQRSYPGASGAFRLGVQHGGYCLGCCWALMLILFAGGVMNLWVIAALTLWVLVEKIAPFGERTPTVSGIVLLIAAAWMIAGA